MKFQGSSNFFSLGLCLFTCLVLSGCNKTYFVKRTSSDPVKQTRLDWNYKTTVDAYQKSSFTSHKWNAPAERALAEFACSRAVVLGTNEPWAEIISTNAAAAAQAGCKDPMLTYLYIKFAMDQTNSKEAFTEAFIATANAMNSSSYPPIRKFYASLRAEQQYTYAYGLYAYQAGQWDTLNKIIPKLGPINYSFFGGTNEFYKMVQLAKENASNPK